MPIIQQYPLFSQGADARQPVPVKEVVDCHHMNYFVSEAGLRALGKVEW
ncbi:hypothetical protein [Candidatus Electrothrix sp.]